MHSQQKRCPQGVAAAFSRGDMHREHRRLDRGKSTASTVVLSGDIDGTLEDACWWGFKSVHRAWQVQREVHERLLFS